MRYRYPAIALCVLLGLSSCKRPKAPHDVPDERPNQAAATQPASAQSATPPSIRPDGGTYSRLQLLRFIRASRLVVAAAEASGRNIDAMPESFPALALAARDDASLNPALAAGHMRADEWAQVGERAWLAWGVAQLDYNAEAPLRKNAADLAAARQRLALAEAAVRSGFPILSEEQRAQRITKAQDEATTATDRAAMWADSAQRLRTQIAEAETAAESADAAGATGGTANTPPAGPQDLVRDPAIVAPNASGVDGAAGPSPAFQQDPTALAAAQQQTAQAARAAVATLSQELAVAERNQQDERDHAERASLSAEHPDLPRDDVEKMDMFRQATAAIEQSKADIQKREQESEVLKARLQDDRRVNAAERQKAAPPADVELLRRYLAEFNEAWGMTVEGRAKPASRG
jgi:hypothetical protein